MTIQTRPMTVKIIFLTWMSGSSPNMTLLIFYLLTLTQFRLRGCFNRCRSLTTSSLIAWLEETVHRTVSAFAAIKRGNTGNKPQRPFP